MTETLTESFCERCGTRYEFHAPTRLNPLRKTRGFIGGLRNYLTSQDDLADAMGDAMRSEEDNLASAQLEAFHESFNFCISCRQYTCLNCWNDTAGRCRSCVPIPGTDDLAERLAASAVAPAPMAAEPVQAQGALHPHAGLDAWPTSDLPTEAAIASNGHAGEQALTVDAAPELEPVVAEGEPEPEPEPVVAELEPEPILAPLRVVAWDEDSAYELFESEPETFVVEAEGEPEPLGPEFEPEPVLAEVEPEPTPEPVVAKVEPEPKPVVAEVEPEPVVAEAAPEPEREPEPVVAEVEPEPEPVAPRPSISDTLVHFPRKAAPSLPQTDDDRAAAAAESPELAARRAQLDMLGLGDPGQGPVAPERTQVPYRSRGAATTPSELARQAALQGSFWEASAREVAGAGGQVGVQSCGQCGLSLSANARFCRRCGTPQAQSA